MSSPWGRTDSPAMTMWRIGSNVESERGFTLIELVCVAVVIGVLTASVLPRFRQHLAQFQTEQTAVQLAQMLRAARSLAVSRGEPIEWRWEADAHRARLVVDQAGDGGQAIPGRLGQPWPWPASVTVSITNDQQPAQGVRFFPDGTSEPVTVIVAGSTPLRYQIAVNEATGYVTLQSTAGISAG